MDLRDDQFYLKALGACTVFMGLIVLGASAFRNPNGNIITQNANGTRTGLAVTKQLFMACFPGIQLPVL